MAIGPPGLDEPNDSGPSDDGEPTAAAPTDPTGDGPALSIDEETPTAGSKVHVTVSDIESVTQRYDLVLAGSVVAASLAPSSDGRVAVAIDLPVDMEGAQQLRLVIAGTGELVASTEFVVTQPGATTSATVIVAVGLALILLLALLIGIRRRKGRESTPAEAAPVLQPATNPETDAAEAAADVSRAAEVAGPATNDVRTVEHPTTPPLEAVPVSPLPGLPSRPWSALRLGATPLAIGEPTDIIVWDGALWITGVRATAAGTQVLVWSSLNGLTWNEPMMLGSGSQPRFAADRSQICVIGDAAAGTHPVIWASTTGADWQPLASGLDEHPAGRITSAMVAGGLLMLASAEDSQSSLWTGHSNGAWIRLDIGFEPRFLSRWNHQLLAFGRRHEGGAALAESEAGIRWTDVDLDTSPSFAAFEPAMLLPIGDQALLIGDDTTDEVAEAWIASSAGRWDPAPIGAPGGTRIVGGVRDDDGVVAVGVSSQEVSVWRTVRGIQWKRVDKGAELDGFEPVGVARYESRIHLLGMGQGEPVIWVRQAFPQPAAREDQTDPGLHLVVDDSVAVERPA